MTAEVLVYLLGCIGIIWIDKVLRRRSYIGSVSDISSDSAMKYTLRKTISAFAILWNMQRREQWRKKYVSCLIFKAYSSLALRKNSMLLWMTK